MTKEEKRKLKDEIFWMMLGYEMAVEHYKKYGNFLAKFEEEQK